MKKGNFGLLFIPNWGRCGDGISDFVSGIEWDLVRARMPLLPEGEVPLGAHPFSQIRKAFKERCNRLFHGGGFLKILAFDNAKQPFCLS